MGARAVARRLCAAALVALALTGCGGSRSAPRHRRALLSLPQGCLPAAISTLARAANVAGGEVSHRLGEGNNDEPQCQLGIGAQRVRVVVNLDSAPQPYSRFERTIDEFAQGFPVRLSAAPQIVSAGLGGAWLPSEREFLTTDGHRLITVTVAWRGARESAQRALGVAVGRLYLGPNSRTARMEEL